MTSEDVRLEFMAQQVDFLLEIESLLPKVKQYVNEKCLNQFYNEYLPEKLRNGYETKISGDNLLIENVNYKGPKFFHLSIYIGLGYGQNFFGVIGNADIFNSGDPNIEAIKNILEEHDMTEWKNWIGHKYFTSRKRDELWPISLSQDALYKFYAQWSDEFLEFEEKVRGPLEKANESLKKGRC